jgi:hypothetical protein
MAKVTAFILPICSWPLVEHDSRDSCFLLETLENVTLGWLGMHVTRVLASWEDKDLRAQETLTMPNRGATLYPPPHVIWSTKCITTQQPWNRAQPYFEIVTYIANWQGSENVPITDDVLCCRCSRAPSMSG